MDEKEEVYTADDRLIVALDVDSFDKMKELWSYWHLSFPAGEAAYAKLRRASVLERYHALVGEILAA